jgi:hypothetical protein
MGHRTLPTECQHGRIIDWGDFGPSSGERDDPCEPCPDCEEDKWVECSCGKVRHVDDRPLIARMSCCKTCGMEACRALDRCPETVPVPGGSSACRLGWRHQGRCEPFDIAGILQRVQEEKDEK